jgi:hypothetical protein
MEPRRRDTQSHNTRTHTHTHAHTSGQHPAVDKRAQHVHGVRCVRARQRCKGPPHLRVQASVGMRLKRQLKRIAHVCREYDLPLCIR